MTCLLLCLVFWAGASFGIARGAAASSPDPGTLAIADIARALDAIPRAETGAPALLVSFRVAPDDASDFARTQRDAAYTYDNALAVLALLAHGDIARARRIGDALVIAQGHDRFWTDGRLRNAYRAGPVDPNAAILLPGWWDQGAAQWREDGYQVGSATGALAFAGLALARLAETTGDARYRAAARALASWIAGKAAPVPGGLGLTGGVIGHEPRPARATWASVEQNADALALFTRLGPDFADGAARARAFIQGMVEGATGRLYVGTTPDGVTQARDLSAVDAMTLAVLSGAVTADGARRALEAARRIHGVTDGVSFSGARDAVWIEGTAQLALALRGIGDTAESARLIAGLAPDRDPQGYWRAIRGARMETGLSTGLRDDQPDFRYGPAPHLAATAWIALAARGVNPLGPDPR